MTLNLTPSESGCLLLGDISGYTSYLQATELEHAQDVLADLLETIVETLQPIFKLSKLEGDAAFAYASDSSLNPTLVMDTVEAGYFAFRRRLRDIDNATSCECNACVLIPSLDLKFFVHYGEFVVRTIAGNEELTGPDVILVHRLMKGSAGEAIGKPAYAAYTAATLDAMGMDPEMLRFLPHTDHFEDIGDVEMFVQDLNMRWAYEQERNRVYVTSSEAILKLEWDIPLPPAVLWEYIADPEKRLQWQVGLTGIDLVTDGRLGTGSTNHCMHGPDVIVEHVADWRPFSYMTKEYPNPVLGGSWTLTQEFTETETGTRLAMRVGPMPKSLEGWWEQTGSDWLAGVTEASVNLASLIKSDHGVDVSLPALN